MCTKLLPAVGPGVLSNAFLTAIFCKYALPYEWNWGEAITFGSIVSATDPVAVVALLKELGASKRLATLIEAESLLNDGTAYVLYVIALDFVKGNSPYVHYFHIFFCFSIALFNYKICASLHTHTHTKTHKHNQWFWRSFWLVHETYIWWSWHRFDYGICVCRVAWVSIQ